MPVTDEDAAIEAISSLESLSDRQAHALARVNSTLRSDDPFVDIHELLSHYNVLYFRGLLLPRVEILWSPRLTLCAGICELSKDPATGKYTRIRLKMSTPLLQYRPRSDTINTLLHEAIHAYFFITTSWRHSRGDDGTGHGAGFQLLADAINNHGNYEITIYHTFHDEVDSYRTHIWVCDGECRLKPPYFGVVKRSMNRPPGKSDSWWAAHAVDCGGTYTKISEPELTKKQKEAMSKKERAGLQKNKLDSWVKVQAKDATVEGSTSRSAVASTGERETSIQTKGKRKAEAVIVDDTVRLEESSSLSQSDSKKAKISCMDDDDVLILENKTLVECPICTVKIAESEINQHLDVLHPPYICPQPIFT